MSEQLKIITPTWQAPKNVVAFSTTRLGGFSSKPFESLNLAAHTDDDLLAVQENRQYLVKQMHLPAQPAWIHQVHSDIVVVAKNQEIPPTADASYTRKNNIICAVLTADCLPILLCNQAGNEVAAIHAGWRSLANDIIENTVAKLKSKPENLLAWLGPSISSAVYEVGEDVYDAFVNRDKKAIEAFKATTPGHWLADLPQLAQQRLHQLGIENITFSGHCTYQENDLFYSFRKEGTTGRFASLIYFTA